MNAVKSANQSRRRAENLIKFVFMAQALSLEMEKKGRKKFFRGLKMFRIILKVEGHFELRVD